MDIDKLRSFNEVIKTGSFAKAAEVVKLSEAGVRRQISAIEDILGHKLFSNVHQRLILTKKGQLFHQYAIKILGLFHEAQKKLVSGSDIFDLYLSTTVAIGSLWIIQAIKDFLRAHPQIRMHIACEDSIPTGLTFDITVRPGPLNLPGMQEKCLMIYTMGLFASKNYIAQHGEPRTLEELEEHHLLAYPPHTAFPYKGMNWHLDLVPQVTPYLTINSGAGLLQAIEEGLGIGSISQIGVKVGHDLHPILPHLKGPEIPIFFGYREGMMSTGLMDELFNILSKKFSYD